MTDLALVENLTPRLLDYSETVFIPAGDGQPDRHIPVAALYSWTEADRNAISVYTIGTDQTPIPSDMRSTGKELRYDQPSNTVSWHDVLEPYPLDERKRAMQGDVNVKRSDQLALGYVHDFGAAFGGAHRLDTRPEDATRWLNYRNACKEQIDAGNGSHVMELPIRTSENVNLNVRANQGRTAMDGMRTRDSNIWKYAWDMKDQIKTAADHAALDAIDINAGWPE